MNPLAVLIARKPKDLPLNTGKIQKQLERNPLLNGEDVRRRKAKEVKCRTKRNDLL